MSAKPTLTSRMDALEAAMLRIESMLTASLPADAPAKVTPTKPVTRKAKVLTRATREAFVKQNPAYKGLSTAAIREAIVAGGEVKGGWTLPSGARVEAIRAWKAEHAS